MQQGNNQKFVSSVFEGIDQRARADWLYNNRPEEAAAILKRYAPWRDGGAKWPAELERAYQTFRARSFVDGGYSREETIRYTGIDPDEIEPEEEEEPTELSESDGLNLL